MCFSARLNSYILISSKKACRSLPGNGRRIDAHAFSGFGGHAGDHVARTPVAVYHAHFRPDALCPMDGIGFAIHCFCYSCHHPKPLSGFSFCYGITNRLHSFWIIGPICHDLRTNSSKSIEKRMISVIFSRFIVKMSKFRNVPVQESGRVVYS